MLITFCCSSGPGPAFSFEPAKLITFEGVGSLDSMRRGLVLSLMESDSPVTYLCNGGGRAIESAVINEVEGFPMRGEHSLRIFATAIIRTLVTDGVALVGSYEAMEDNPIGLMLMERLEAAQSMSVDAMREWLNNE